MNNKIISNGETIYRILVDDESRCLVVDCLKRTVPCWVKKSELDTFNKVVSEEDFLEATKWNIREIGEMSREQLKEMHLRFATISYPLAKVGDEVERRLAIHQASKQYGVSEQTIRHRLRDYLVFQNIMVLAPGRKIERGLTIDESNFRCALNKYFYNSKKFSLRQTYKYLVSEKYIDTSGKLLQNYPKFHQFRYFYYKTRSESNFVISRWGRGEYDRNYRPLLGEGVRSFCPTIGYGMLDSTTCDIFLVNDSGELIGRPILTACVDAYSSMCLGYSLGWEGGINSLRKLMMNVAVDKVEWCRKFGIEIDKNDWDSQRIPHKLITDMGSEYVGDTFTNLTDLGVEIVNLEPYRPELKSVVERFFGLVQESFKKELINKGVVLKNFGDRGVIDYRKNACLTLEQFEKILLLCIIHYNCGRTIELPYEVSGIKNHANALWNNRLAIDKDVLIEVDSKLLRLTLLPRCAGRFRRDGLIVNKLRYKAFGFTNEYLKGEECQVAYDSENVGTVWLLKDGAYVVFTIIDTFLDDKTLSEVKGLDSGSTGGVDIIVFIINKYTSIKQSILSFVVDGTVIALGIFVLGDMIASLIGIIAAFITAMMIEYIFVGRSRALTAMIISKEHIHEINDYIQNVMERGSTFINVEGGYQHHEYQMIMVTFDRKEYANLINKVAMIDKKAFLTVIQTNEVLGEGFRAFRNRRKKRK